ncbi:geranylgeranyl reductase family protein [Maridesulfovibrio hydrothermalis]|uniref:Geranylgeranyl reductase n=1 Tax=Maridesulfovibrio hydrothermalis AM13 = DSM 14728 TaxID=1121451 RepID=L0RBZ7_9BACT|nr:geranylgeranyl reductase family protein [Maridesulfovibrio hydrothermalis]CCO23076.1 Geranylgeranyl reductase [Maridesulfovibrio hydrothermalis AM13 = DSM 14728]
MSGKFDVIIAGGGPTGSTAACVLARKGFKVAIIDKAEFPRKKLCGGLITHKTIQTLEKVFDCNADLLKEKGIINFESPEYSIHYRDHKIRDAKSSIPFRFVDRVDFDYFLLQKAANAGAHIFTGEEITCCNYKDAEIKTKSNRIFKGKYLIGADGVNSTIRKFLPYDKEKWRENMASTIEIIFDAKDFPREVKKPELYIGHLKAGYLWVFPAKGKVVTGIGALNRCTTNFKATYMDFLKSQGIVNPESLPMRGFPLPYGNFMKNPCFGRTILAGDAAGLVEPLFGEGIFYALQSGRYVADAIAKGIVENKNPEQFYIPRLEKYVFPELQYSNRLRWTLFYSQRLLKHMSFKIAFKSMPRLLADMVHGVRSYKFMLKKKWD